MSDITDTRKSQEYLLASETDPHPTHLMKAAIHASLASARALRELDGTTHRTVRLLGDSVDELSADLVRVLTPGPANPFAPLGAGQLVNINHITAMVDVRNEDGEDNATMTEIWLTDGNVIYCRAPISECMAIIERAS